MAYCAVLCCEQAINLDRSQPLAHLGTAQVYLAAGGEVTNVVTELENVLKALPGVAKVPVTKLARLLSDAQLQSACKAENTRYCGWGKDAAASLKTSNGSGIAAQHLLGGCMLMLRVSHVDVACVVRCVQATLMPCSCWVVCCQYCLSVCLRL